MNLRNISLTLASVAAVLCAAAQGTHEEFKRELAQPDSLRGSRVVVGEERGLQQIFGRVRNAEDHVKGFRVRIFLDNRQNARAGSAAAAKKFSELFPGVPCYPDYHELYFRVTVGDCLSTDEAQMLLARVVREFPNAFVVPEDIPLSKFVIEKKSGTPPADTVSVSAETI